MPDYSLDIAVAHAQDSTEQAMRAYELFFNLTGWRMARLEHLGPEKWIAFLFQYKNAYTRSINGSGKTAAIAICEAIKAASFADAERATAETEVRG